MLYPGYFTMFGLKNVELQVALERNYNDQLWARAREARVPVSFHVGCISHVPDRMKASAGRDPIAAYSGTAALIHDTRVELTPPATSPSR